MLGRITAGLVVTFWIGMMAALVRMEFFPQGSALGDVPPEVVLRKVFHHEEDTRLNVFYQGQGIGFCKVEITPLTTLDPLAESTTPTPTLTNYRVRSELTLTLQLMGMPSRLRCLGDSLFNQRYEMESFHLNTTIGDGKIDVSGDALSQKVKVDFEFGDLRDKREFDFSQVQGAGLASAMGLPGLANFSFLGGGGVPTAFGGGDGQNAQSKTVIYLTDLRVDDVALRAYLVESKLDQNMWAKMWVSERGEVLKVTTSFGLTMLADVLSDQSLQPQQRREVRP